MAIAVNISGQAELARIQAHLARLSDTGNRKKLLNLIGAEAETQTHRRIRDEKTAPDGTPWESWSDAYAKTRHGNHALLMGEGELDDSIQYLVKGNKVYVGSPLIYAAVHQEGFDGAVQISAHHRRITQAFGKVLRHPVWQSVAAHVRHMKVPKREYLGLSQDNQQDLYALIGDFYGELLP
ncbi:phage virion morphogenesis protein [Grimontia hollisae]|uniref:phage virion morphogenesis protein n=1 Tax=Grimontia hollisae TaxID=673 RepID=UPI0013035AE4|nr:phage virion morphogenesis protein [Grimontia hollisae]MDF2186150.1 phage virion morphogenesis protein [Grimontia hollisae]